MEKIKNKKKNFEEILQKPFRRRKRKESMKETSIEIFLLKEREKSGNGQNYHQKIKIEINS